MTLDVEQARELIEKATPPQWWSERKTTGEPAVWTAEGDLATEFEIPFTEADADFIAAARTGWPEALDALVTLQAENGKQDAELAELTERFDEVLYTNNSHAERAEAAEMEAATLQAENENQRSALNELLALSAGDKEDCEAAEQEAVTLRERVAELTEVLQELYSEFITHMGIPPDCCGPVVEKVRAVVSEGD